MEDVFNKLVKFAGVTAISVAAFMSMGILDILACIGANQMILYDTEAAQIPSSVFVGLGNSMLIFLVSGSVLVLLVFIWGFWLCTTVWIFQKDISSLWNWLKRVIIEWVE